MRLAVLSLTSAPLFFALAQASAQESRAILDAPLVVTPGYRLGTLVDLDGDGYQDSIGWWFGSSGSTRIYLFAYMNDRNGALLRSNGSFVSLTPTAGDSPYGSADFHKCDLNGDGRDDFGFAFVGSGGSAAFAFESNGAAAPRLVPTYTITGAHHVVYADFDGDGVCDAAVTRANQLELHSFAAVPGGDPVGTLRSVQPISGVVEALFTVDANGDATPDLYVNTGNTGRLFPVSDFTLGAPVVFPHGIGTMPMPVAGDTDGDGDVDLVVFSMTSFVTFRRTGPASWTLEPERTGGPATHLFDVDGDGDLDGACCGGGPGIPRNDQPSTFRVALNDGQGGFAPAFEFAGLGSDHMAGAADLDHDGDLDLVAGRCVYYSRGGLRANMMPTLGASADLRVNVNDFDGDLDPDFELKYGSVHRNLGDGRDDVVTSHWPASVPSLTYVGNGFPGDFDGDGDVDLLVHRYTSAGFTLCLLANNGGGGFTDAGQAGPHGVNFAPYIEGMTAARALVRDMDADGDLDLVVRNRYWDGQTRMYANDGTGRFMGAPVIVPGTVLCVADLNADGVMDLVLQNTTPAVRLGFAAWNFAPEVALDGPNVWISTDAAAVGDLDSDGDLDIALTPTSTSNWSVEVHWNSGAGTFTREALELYVVSAGLGGNPAAMTIADLNGDALPDLVAGHSLDTAAAYVVLRRSDNSGFDPAILQAIYADRGDGRTVVNGATAVDVDGDGDLDLVTDHLLRNTHRSGPDHGHRQQGTTGIPGAGAMLPTLGENGPFNVGSSVTMRLTGACAQSTGLLIAAWDQGLPFSSSPIGGMSIPRALPITSMIPFTTNGAALVEGSGTWSLSYTVPAYKAGRTYRYVALVDDPAAPGGRSMSSELVVTYGF